MKPKITLFFVIFFLSSEYFFAQDNYGISSEHNWLANWTNFKPTVMEYEEATVILTGIIDKDLKLKKSNTYLLIGTVYVTNNAILSIEQGTLVRGDKDSCGTLVITKGAKIIAIGIETDPIVFTSNKNIMERKSGDWGGIVILGDAPINKLGNSYYLDLGLDSNYSRYGGENINSNSGILKYVRIEFAGRKIKNLMKEFNGLSLAGVGRKTQIEYIQISYSNDDSFECYGGNIKLNNLVSFRATDDDFDFTQGVLCDITDSIAIRNPFTSDSSGSRCFEIDTFDKKDNAFITNHHTKVIAKHITLLNIENNNQGLVREAIFIGEKAIFSISNSLISGFRTCFLLNDNSEIKQNDLFKITFNDLNVNQCKNFIENESILNNEEINQIYLKNTVKITFTNKLPNEIFIQPDLKKQPDFRIKI